MTISMSSQVPEAVYVVLHMSNGPSKADVAAGTRAIVDAGDPPFRLTEDIWMERFDKELGKKIETACSPAQYNLSDVGHDRHLYAFVRKVPSGEKSKYEGMSVLAGLIALSRLVHPNSHRRSLLRTYLQVWRSEFHYRGGPLLRCKPRRFADRWAQRLAFRC